MHTVLLIGKWLLITIGSLIAILILGFLLVPPLTRGFTDRWGATKAEVAATLPGDEHVADPKQNSTKAITIHAPADTVYSLLVQMGYQRGGWYGWDWFYNMTGSSDFVGGKHAETMVPELQKFGVGDQMAINKMVTFDALVADRPTALVLATAHAADASPVPITSPKSVGGMTWAWIVQPIDANSCRLILRTRSGGASQGGFVDWLYNAPLDFGGAVMGYKTLIGIRNAAEKLAAQK